MTIINNFNIVHKDIVTSTMDEIKKCNSNTLIFVDVQTNGRGKGDRNWVSNDNLNLYMSLMIDTTDKNINYSNFSFLSSVCVMDTINYFTKNTLDVQTKWPNDVLINQKKVCGILLEFDIMKKQLIIGIGVNLVSHPENVLFDTINIKELGFIIKREEFIEYFLEKFDYYFNDLKLNGFKLIHDIWLKNSYNYKKQITVKNNKFDIVGIFEDFSLDGTLILKENDGNIIKIISGDIF